MSVQEHINQHIAKLPEHLQLKVLDFILSLDAETEKEAAQGAFIRKLMEMPDVGLDEDFERVQDTTRAGDVFD